MDAEFMNASTRAVRVDGGTQVFEILAQRVALDDLDLADAGLALERLLAREHRHAGAELGERLQILRDLALVVATEAGEPVLHVAWRS